MIVEVIFWVSLFGVLYSYFIYPLLLLLFTAPKKDKNNQQDETYQKPTLTLIITAHNEEARIRQKIENCLKISYLKDKFEIIIASDCSNDSTDDITREYINQGVKLVRSDQRYGKEYAQGLAIKEAKGEILVFSDVATSIPEDSLNILADIYSDKNIGAVSSVDKFITESGQIVGEGLYVRYEMWLRRMESGLAGLVGLSGSFFSARKVICSNWETDLPSDFNVALNCIEKGFKAISDDRITGIYKDVKDSNREYQRKFRTVIRGLTAIFKKFYILNPLKYRVFSWQIMSHKIMRWAVPWFMIILLISSLILFDTHFIYKFALVIQIAFYALAVIGWFFENTRNNAAVKIIFYFVQSNIAIAHATIQYICGHRIITWTPSTR